jgi:2-polyprenyl-3-methyl-5-hydroxy-6-metoxy-1,4-benzoquinol methylase
VTGIDLSREQVELAWRLGTKGIYEADVFTFAIDRAETYDCVIAVDVAEHFDPPDARRFFATLRSLLRPGGCVILRTPNGSSPYHGNLLFGDVTHGTAYTTRSLRQIAAATGFGAVATYPCRPSGTGFRQLARRCIWAALEALMILPLIAETGEVRGHVVTQNLVCIMTLGSP